MSDIDFNEKNKYTDFSGMKSSKTFSPSATIFEEKKKKKFRIFIVIVVVLIACIVASIVNIAKCNNTINVKNIIVEHEDIPASFSGYKILQISDINGKEFGDRQEELIALVKGLDYDMILLTGDYYGEDKNDPWALLDLLDGLETDKPIYYILGEEDVEARDTEDDDWMMCINPPAGNQIVTALEERGALSVYPAQRIESAAGEYIYLTGIKNNNTLKEFDFEAESEFSICVTHKPIDYNVDSRLRDVNTRIITELDYDLNIAGHTLGGQYKLPILGTVYTSDYGIFPQEKQVYGLSTDSSGRYNYICGGLGVKSGFRVGISPEISIIELKSTGK
ncbi:MAG: metallophosphoesterase [Clostridia bacterium]|nr:metallophosphoesterase [Clostridia bacterium]